MSKTDSFLSNECMKTITELHIKFPNDMEFGRAVRVFIQDTQRDDSGQIKTPSSQPDMGDVNEH